MGSNSLLYKFSTGMNEERSDQLQCRMLIPAAGHPEK